MQFLLFPTLWKTVTASKKVIEYLVKAAVLAALM